MDHLGFQYLILLIKRKAQPILLHPVSFARRRQHQLFARRVLVRVNQFLLILHLLFCRIKADLRFRLLFLVLLLMHGLPQVSFL